jgi:hypothetical protein
MLRNISVGSPGYVHQHFVGGVYETYVRIPVDGLTCGQEIDDLADGPVDQLSLNEILRLLLVRRSS